ncbi:MAG TPA: DNA repair exonuclease [Rubrivivax sp.]|nr:DNA repair exonuclease [Rubrivivax sp.]
MTLLLHTADWQIGRTYTRFAPEDSAALAEARIATVERLAERAAERRADAVLVAGDVFDAQAISPRTLRRLFNALAPYTGPWVMIPGNHDAALAEGVWAQARRLALLPPNLHLRLQPGIVELPALKLAVLAAPLTQRHTYDDATAWFDAAATPAGWLRVGLAHGAVQGLLPQDVDATNPIAPDRAARAHLDYLALGDWHGCKRIDARCWYAGTPEPERFKDNDPGHLLWVRLEAPGDVPQVEAEAIARHRWYERALALAVPSDVDAAIAQLDACGAGDVLALTLAGRVDLAAHQRLQRALQAAQARLRALVVDETDLRLAPTAEDIAALRADGYLGAVIAELRDAAPAQQRQAQDALALLAALLAEQRETAAAEARA